MPMPSATVLRDVSLSLRKLITDHIQELNERQVYFDSPGEMSGDGQVKLTIFLYRLVTDPWTANQVPRFIEENGKFIEVPVPQALNLNYIMVPYAPEATTELLLADKLRRLFFDIPALTGDLLLGGLRAAGNQKINIMSTDPPMEKIHNLWTGFAGKPYKLSLFYNLAPTFIPRRPKQVFTPVGSSNLGSGEDGVV